MNFPASTDQNVVEKNGTAFGLHVTRVDAISHIDRNNHV
jgi:hypothetical protein